MTKNEDSKGGAIYFRQIKGEAEELCIYNNFTYCQSKFSGGAIFVYCNEVENLEPDDTDNIILLVKIQNCIFVQCFSRVEGGAISSGLYNEETKSIEGDNDLQITLCNFTQCKSGKGGALFFQDGTKEGDEETVIEGCHFYECYADGDDHEGYSISCRSYSITIRNCDFHDHHVGELQTFFTKDCIVYIEMNEVEIQPEILNLTFENINGVSGLIVKMSSMQSVVISNLQFDNIQGEQPCINLDLWEAKTVQIIDSTFTNIFNSRCIMSTLINHRIHVELSKCLFENNSLFVIDKVEGSDIIIESYGGSIYLQGEANTYITQCNFTNSTSILGGGAIYAEAQSIELNYNRFVNCSAIGDSIHKGIHGGCVYLNQENEQLATEGNYEILSSNTFINCHSVKSGGAIFVYCHDEFQIYKSTRDIDDENHNFVVSIIRSTFIECSSEFEGGAISSGTTLEEFNDQLFLGTNDIHIFECTFTLCQSGRGGALFFHDGDKDGDEETIIERCHFYECYADGDDHEGYSISCRSYSITIRNCDFHDHHVGELQTFFTKDCIVYIEMNEIEVQPEILNLTFENINGVSGLIIKMSSRKKVVISNLQFDNIQGEQPCIDLDKWLIRESLTIEYSNFTNIFNSRCIKSTTEIGIFSTTIENCQFINNSISKTSGNEYFNGCGSCILCLRNNIYSSIEFLNCEFNGNSVSGNKGGAIWINSTIRCSIKNCSFINNTVSLNLKQGHAICVDESSNFFVTEQSKSSQFSNSQPFTSSLNFCESTLFSETETVNQSNLIEYFTPSKMVIYSNSFTLTFVMRRSVSFSNSYFYSSTYSLSYIEELDTFVPFYYETLFQSYFPYIIHFYSPSYVVTFIELSLKKKKGITQEQLIGVTCGAVSVFFFIVWIIIIVIRKKNKILNQYNEYDDISDSIEEEQEEDRKIDQEKDQIQDIVSDNCYDENFWLV